MTDPGTTSGNSTSLHHALELLKDSKLTFIATKKSRNACRYHRCLSSNYETTLRKLLRTSPIHSYKRPNNRLQWPQQHTVSLKGVYETE